MDKTKGSTTDEESTYLVSFFKSITIPYSSITCMTIYVRNIFYPCGMSITSEYIKEVKISILNYHNNNQYPTVFFDKYHSFKDIYYFLNNI